MKKVLLFFLVLSLFGCNNKGTGPADKYKLTLDDNGGTGGSGVLYYTNGGGDIVAGWYSDDTLATPISSVSVPAKAYTVSFDVNNGGCTETIEDKTSIFIFNGYKQSDSIKIGSNGNLGEYTISSDVTLNADWGGQSSITLPALTDMTDFEFKGWKNGDMLLAGSTYTPDSSATLEAVWKSDFAFVEGGTFILGDGLDSDNKPVSITLSDFYICDHEVTQAEYANVMEKDPPDPDECNFPVGDVTWYNAVEYCNKLSELKGLEKCYSGNGDSIECDWSKNGYRLPTEAEWEYAAKGGKKSKGYMFFSGSYDIDAVACYIDNTGGYLCDVKTRKANELGLYDMSGNVWEWCWDWYDESGYSAGSNPHGPASGSLRVRRGGSCTNDPIDCRVSVRASHDVSGSSIDIGFRVARSCL